MELTRENSCRMANMGILCALFVVIIHVWGPSSEGTFWSKAVWQLLRVRQIAVPYFFLASGFFLASHFEQEHWWTSEFRKRLNSLFVPFLVWSIGWQMFIILLRLGANYVKGFDAFSDVELLIDIQRLIGLSPYEHPLLPTLWFVRVLLVFVGISPLMKFLLEKFPLPTLIGSFILWGMNRGYGVNVGNVRYFFYDFCGFGWVFFFIVGIYIRRTTCTLNKGMLKILGIVGVCMFITQLLITKYQLHNLVAGKILSYGITKIIVLPLMLSIWLTMPSKRLLPSVVNCAFPIYILHWFALPITRRLIPHGCNTLTGLVGEISLAFGTSLLMSILIKKFCPKVAKVVFGGR